MPKYLVEIETSKIEIFEVKAKDADRARQKALSEHELMDSVEEHENTEVLSVRKMA